MQATEALTAMPPVAYSYLRFSHASQAEGDSARRQESFAERVCREKGWRLDDSLMLRDEGCSAYRGKHREHTARKTRGLALFLEAVKSGRVSPGSVLIVENIDRLSREEVDEAYDLFRGILKAGITILTRDPPREYNRENCNNLLNLLEPLFCMARAHEESRLKSMRVKEAWGKKKRRAVEARATMSRWCPRWIRVVGQDGQPLGDGQRAREADRYELVPERAEIVRRIFRLAVEGMGVFRITRQLKSEGAPCFGRKGKWTTSYVRMILRSPTAWGAYQPGEKVDGRTRPAGELVPGYYPAAVTEAEWQKANAGLRGRKGTGRPGLDEANLFTALTWEATTRNRMSVKPVTSCGRNYKYLVAYQDQWDKPVERGRGMRYEPFEALILRTIAGLEPADLLEPGRKTSQRERRMEELTSALEKASHRLPRLKAQLAAPDLDPDKEALLLETAEKLTKQQKAMKAELQQLQQEATSGWPEALGEVKTVIRLLKRVKETPEEATIRLRLKAKLRGLLDSVWVRVQPAHRTCRVIHAHIYFRSGQRRYVWSEPPATPPPGFRLWDHSFEEGFDYRAGQVGDVTADALAGA